jgi:soluble lytic murein transglycosylase-like protein
VPRRVPNIGCVKKTVITPILVALVALLAAAVPPEAMAPAPEGLLACAPPAADPAGDAAGGASAPPTDPVQQALIQHLSRRYFIAAEFTERIVGAAHRVAREVGLDPLLVLAVISVESRFNPIAESVMGAKGLMQIIPKYHAEKLRAAGGEDAVFDPESNIEIGARILKEYVRRTGTLEAGLQFYNGASRDTTSSYAQKVFAERSRLLQVVSGIGST